VALAQLLSDARCSEPELLCPGLAAPMIEAFARPSRTREPIACLSGYLLVLSSPTVRVMSNRGQESAAAFRLGVCSGGATITSVRRPWTLFDDADLAAAVQHRATLHEAALFLCRSPDEAEAGRRGAELGLEWDSGNITPALFD